MSNKKENRSRIISWLFSEKEHQKREPIIQNDGKIEDKEEELKQDINKNNEKIPSKSEEKEVTTTSQGTIEQNEEVINDNPQSTIEQREEIVNDKPQSTIEQNEEVVNDKPKSTIEQREEVVNVKPQNTIEQREEVVTIAEQSTIEQKEGETTLKPYSNVEQNEPLPLEQKPTQTIGMSPQQPLEPNNIPTQLFPSVEEVNIGDEKQIENTESNEIIRVAIIEEIESIIKNDSKDLNDLKYQIEVLSQQINDEVLLENVEKIQKELDELIRKFEEIKKKYEHLYINISIKDINLIEDLNVGLVLSDYIVNAKEGYIDDKTINQINEIKEFIDIINNIIDFEKEKDKVQDNVDNKLIEFKIRDEDFVKLQDDYANIEKINDTVTKFNKNIKDTISDINNKLKDNVDFEQRIDKTINIIPDLNRIMQATILMASATMIPPTPNGQVFKGVLMASAIHMMANALVPREEENVNNYVTVTDYSSTIMDNQDSVRNALNDIQDAFYEISTIKELFEKDFSIYQGQIPEYDEFIKNIFSIEKELSRQQDLAYQYDSEIEQSLALNDQKVKTYEG